MSYEGNRLASAFPVKSPPRASNWTLRQTSTNGTLSDLSSGGLTLFGTNRSVGEDTIIADIAAPATPYTFTMGFISNFQGSLNYSAIGLVGYETSTTKNRGAVFYTDVNNFYNFITRQQTGLTGAASGSIAITPYSNLLAKPFQFLRLADDGTNRVYSFSTDGVTFHQLASEARATGFTTAPDRIGFAIYPLNARAGIAVHHWVQT